MTPELIEKMARAMHGAYWEGSSETDKHCYYEAARDALKAIEEAGFVVAPRPLIDSVAEFARRFHGDGANYGYDDPDMWGDLLKICNEHKAMIAATQTPVDR